MWGTPSNSPHTKPTTPPSHNSTPQLHRGQRHGRAARGRGARRGVETGDGRGGAAVRGAGMFDGGVLGRGVGCVCLVVDGDGGWSVVCLCNRHPLPHLNINTPLYTPSRLHTHPTHTHTTGVERQGALQGQDHRRGARAVRGAQGEQVIYVNTCVYIYVLFMCVYIYMYVCM